MRRVTILLGLVGLATPNLILRHGQDEDGWVNLVPGSRASPVVKVDLEVDLTFTCHSKTTDEVIWHVQYDYTNYKICLDGGNLPVCTPLSEGAANGGMLALAPPESGGGISRVSAWLRHERGDGSGRGNIIETNLTTFLWVSEREAAAELHRRLAGCDHKTLLPTLNGSAAHDAWCGEVAVLRRHLVIAESRLQKAAEASQGAAALDQRAHRSIEVVTTIFNGRRWGKKQLKAGASAEGYWVAPLASIDPNVSFVVMSATPVGTVLGAAKVMDSDISDARLGEKACADAAALSPAFRVSVPEELLKKRNIHVVPHANPGRAQECPGLLSYLVRNSCNDQTL